jgi:hypothetical protein
MSWAFGPSAVVVGRAVSLGGTVLIGEDGPIELNPFTARMLRALAARPAGARQVTNDLEARSHDSGSGL